MRHMAGLPIMRAFLIVTPLLIGARFAATAAWGEPSGAQTYSDRLHVYVYLFAATVCVVWSVMHTHIQVNAYASAISAMICMYRAVNTVTTSQQFGDVSYVATVFWLTFSVGCVLAGMMGVQWCILRDLKLKDHRG